MRVTADTFISPVRAFSDAYNGRLVEFLVRPGTVDDLASVGVRDVSRRVRMMFPDMPVVQTGWADTAAFFKGEGNQVNIGLGNGPGLRIFNSSIVDFRELLR